MTYRLIFIFLIFINFSYAINKEDIIKLYQEQNYRKACIKAGDLYNKYKDDEDFLSMYADACIQVDMINRTMLPIIKLYKTPKARENAAYFATILYQKKLLYHALVDDVDISYVNLPKTRYILSVIFNKFVGGDYEYKNGVYWFNDDNKSDIKYKLSVETHQKIKKIFLRTYKDGEIIKVRTYW